MGRRPKARRNSYGAWLHYLRREAKLTQEEAAKVTGIPRTTLTTWERTGELPGAGRFSGWRKPIEFRFKGFFALKKLEGGLRAVAQNGLRIRSRLHNSVCNWDAAWDCSVSSCRIRRRASFAGSASQAQAEPEEFDHIQPAFAQLQAPNQAAFAVEYCGQLSLRQAGFGA